jgi:hypothetical protein
MYIDDIMPHSNMQDNQFSWLRLLRSIPNDTPV